MSQAADPRDKIIVGGPGQPDDRIVDPRVLVRPEPGPQVGGGGRVVDVVSESVLRVWKPASVSTSILSRVSDMAVTIASTRASASGGTVCA